MAQASMRVATSAAEEDLRLALNSLDMGVLIVNDNLEMEFMNPVCYELWNVDPEKLQPGSNFRELLKLSRDLGFYDIDDDKWDGYVESRVKELERGNIASREFQRADGKTMVYRVTNLSGKRRLVSYFDISEQKQKQEALERAEEIALSADRAKSEFLANMSHEIRTPMNGVMGMAELLVKTDLDAKQRMFADVILKSGSALLTIINDILDFSKIEAGQMGLDPAPFRLAEAVEDVATLVSSRVAEKDLELIVRVDPILPKFVIGDVGRLRQIVTNLMGNAVKFTDVGHVYVNVSGVHVEARGEHLVELEFRVEDTGIGIPEEDLEKVFAKFSQVDSSATRKHEGTGLGLSIASSLVELMSGTIGVESVEGSGTTFWFKVKLPIADQELASDSTPVCVLGSRVLIVDDNEVNRSILCEQMSSWDFDNAAVKSGEEALAFLEAATDQGLQVDCVIMDYHMPGANGIETVLQIKQKPELSEIPILMLTSVNETEDGTQFSSLGIQAHLVKPARSSLLRTTIIDILQKSKSALQNRLSNGKAQIA